MSLRTVTMGGGKGPNQRVFHGQNDAVRGGGGGGGAPKAKTAKELKMEKLRQSLHGENAHVPDCLVWNVKDKTEETAKRSKGPKTKGQREQRKDYSATTTEDGGREFTITSYKALPRNPELGRPKNHLYGDEGPPDAQWKESQNDGGVAEAMVGWPRARREEEEKEEGERRKGRDGTAWDVDRGDHDDGAKENKKKPQRKQRIADGDSDVVMDELISHRFLRESADLQRQRREQQATDQATAHRNRHNFRGNKTSVLRAEAIGDAWAWRQTEDPKELWKMSRFANARSRLNDCTQCRRHDCYHEDGRGFPMESCRKDCRRKCDENKADEDRQMERHNGTDNGVDNGRGRCDHRTCGCVPEHQRSEATHEDRSHQNRLNQYSDDEEKTKYGFYVI